MPKKKKKDEAPLKKKELLKLHIQELDERLLASTNERDGLAAKLAALATGYQDLEAKNKDLVTRHSSLVTEREALHSDHSSLRTLHSSLVAERDALVTRHSSLVTSQQSLVTSSKSLTSERDTLKAKLAALEKAHQELVTRHSSLVASEKELVTRHSSLATAFKELESKHSSLVTSSKDTSEENELLIQQLHQVQEELEHYFLENKRLCVQQLTAPTSGTLQITGLHLGNSEDSCPHRHLNFDIEGVILAGQEVGKVHLRLVEHHGRAGVVVLATDDGKHPMKSWREDGREGNRSFLLVVPQNEGGRSYIQTAHAHDLILLREATLIAASQLAQDAPPTSSLPAVFWRSLALRFVASLDEMHDHLCAGDVVVEPGESAGSFRFRIQPALVHGHVLPALCGSWHDGNLVLDLPTNGEPPLTAWPRKDDGHPIDSLSFSFDRRPRQEHKTLRASLTKTDRRILTALLRALPAIAGSYTELHVGGALSATPSVSLSKKTFERAAKTFEANGTSPFLTTLLRRPR